MEYGDTQIIYSTHSTFISEASNISNINILSKSRNLAEVFQPVTGLASPKITKLQRYLDAVRSNLLFAKGVILIEGDAEAILIPQLVKCVLGISLDELGVSLINIGSTGFENVAQLFNDLRLRRKCSIVTDTDKAICDTTELTTDSDDDKKYKKKVFNSQKSGIERKTKLDLFTKHNKWLKPCYAKYTFEIDFVFAGNEPEVVKTINEVYSDVPTRQLAKTEIEHADLDVWGKRILSMAKYNGKGWYAILLGGYVTYLTVLPDYIMDAIVFAKSTLSRDTIVSILEYRIKEYSKNPVVPDFLDLKLHIQQFRKGEIELDVLIKSISNVIEHDQIIPFFQKL